MRVWGPLPVFITLKPGVSGTDERGRAFAVKVATKRLPVLSFSGFDLYHHVRNDAFYDLYNLLKVRKTGKWEVFLLQPLPQTLYHTSPPRRTEKNLLTEYKDVTAWSRYSGAL